MKFAQELRRDEQPELLELYKKLKKSLKIFEGPADARSMVEADASSDSEDEGDRSPSRSRSAADNNAAAVATAGQPGSSAAAAAAAAAGVEAQEGAAAQQGAAAPLAGGAPPDAEQQQAQQAQQAQAQAQRRPGAPDAAQEARFTALVEQCVQQLNDDYLSREEMLVIKADLAQSAAYFASSREELSAAYTGMVNLHGELVLLCHWSMTAYTGIVKILKKHYKRTGQRVQSALLANLLAQPFCSLEEVRGMVRAAEAQMSALAAKLGLAGQAPPSAGAAAAAAVRDPRAAAPPAALGGLLSRGSPAMGESFGGLGQAAQQAQQAAWQQDGLPRAAERPARAAAAEVDFVAASGAARPRPALKRDRSKNYTEANKRHEALWGLGLEPAEEPRPAPASSGSSMQASQGGTPRAAQQHPAGDTASSGGGGGGGGADAAQRGSIMQRTKAALQLWKALRSNASTPSTIISQPPGA
ncbi:hypothetical protein ABPG75_005092 [Micractinium tetrahymenae]